MRTLVLANPGARNGGDPGWRAAVAELPDWEVREAGEERTAMVIRAAVDEGVRRIVAAGGDGTVSLVANGLAEAEALDLVALGVLPLGTANDYARSLGLPLDPEEAIEVIRTGRARRVDLGHVDGLGSRWFVNVAVGGFGGRVNERVASEKKRVWGPLAYLRTAAEEIANPERYRLHARLDDEEMEVEALHVIVANGTRSGGNIPVAPDARLDDGLLDVVLVPALELPDLIALAPRFLAGGHVKDDRLVVRRVSEARFRAEPPMPFGADGEPLGSGMVEFGVAENALAVIVPPKEDLGRAAGS